MRDQFLNPRSDKLANEKVAKVMRECARLQGSINFICTWIEREVSSMVDAIDFCLINQIDIMDRDLICETLGNILYFGLICHAKTCLFKCL